MDVIEKNEKEGMKPEKVARVIEKIINTGSPKASYVVGSLTEKMAILLQQTLPFSWFERLLMSFYNMESKP